MDFERLSRDFFNRPTLLVAQELLGKKLVFKNFSGFITETEAYTGDNDPACHAYRRITNRSRVMYGPPGYSYIYLIYGMYYCLNIVTGVQGAAASVLIRGLNIIYSGKNEPLFLRSNKNKIIIQNDVKLSKHHYNGPGKLCRFLGLNKDYNDIDLTTSDFFYLTEGLKNIDFITTPRIGITKGIEYPWRFVLKI